MKPARCVRRRRRLAFICWITTPAKVEDKLINLGRISLFPRRSRTDSMNRHFARPPQPKTASYTNRWCMSSYTSLLICSFANPFYRAVTYVQYVILAVARMESIINSDSFGFFFKKGREWRNRVSILYVLTSSMLHSTSKTCLNISNVINFPK